uniref:Sushi domain-containing protein n=1 Tax=Tetradesmus obliquus TaxID=3088 RepID=A0A383VTP3_TETOB|eukprot:jgi/Sobl393_1/10484/SZX68152.1
MAAASRSMTTAVALMLLAVSVSARRLATIPPGNDAGDNPHTCCRCKCLVATPANSTKASGALLSGVSASNPAPSSPQPNVPCVLPPNSPPGSTGCVTPTYGKKRICKSGFLGSCDEVCLVDNGGWTSYNTC